MDPVDVQSAHLNLQGKLVFVSWVQLGFDISFPTKIQIGLMISGRCAKT
jgi:hypothetical protein